MNRIAVLMTVHDRKEKTIQCLQGLFLQSLPTGWHLSVYLTDDGCKDGTPAAVKKHFPEVNIINGDGSLFWNKGMCTAWEYAAESETFDGYLWLNDDCLLHKDCLSKILTYACESAGKAVIVASMSDSSGKTMTYGGHLSLKGDKAIPNGKLQECVTMNGNCVYVPNEVFFKCGTLDKRYTHAIGDIDYGYTVRRNGFQILASKEFLGVCENNRKTPLWMSPDVPLLRRFKNLYTPYSYSDPREYFYFEKKNFTVFKAFFHFLTIHIRAIFPRLWSK